MSTPKWFRLSDVPTPVRDMFMRTEGLRAAHKLEPREIARLGRDDASGHLTFQEASARALQKGEDPLGVAEAWEGFAVSFFVRTIRAFVYLHFWRLDGLTGLGVEIDDQVPYVEPAGMAEGEWLERFLCDYVTACGSRGCANEWERPYSLKPFNVKSLVSLWREKGLPREPFRGFFMVSKELVSAEDVRAWAENRSARDKEWLRYFQVEGYHVFSTLSLRSGWTVSAP